MRTPIVVPDQFILLIEGRPFVLYAGLLHVAQEEGIKELSVSIQQIPSIQNGQTAIGGKRPKNPTFGTTRKLTLVELGFCSFLEKITPHVITKIYTRLRVELDRSGKTGRLIRVVFLCGCRRLC